MAYVLTKNNYTVSDDNNEDAKGGNEEKEA